MTPNLFLATQTLFSPHKWFKPSKQARSSRPVRTVEHWSSPVPGIYEYIPGRGWYLVATDKDPNAPAITSPTSPPSDGKTPSTTVLPGHESENGVETVKLAQPIPIKHSKVLKKHLLAPDYFSRKRHGRIKDDSNGRISEAGFFRLDDGVAWVHCWDQHGEFIPGPYQLWFWDGDAEGKVGRFRHMRKGDDPEYVHSRANSRENSTHRKSQDSRSTQFRAGSGSASASGRDSQPSTRAGSLKGLTVSAPGSRSVSRPGTPKGNRGRCMDRTLSEATTLLNPIAAEQAAAGRARAVEQELERGREKKSSAAVNRE